MTESPTPTSLKLRLQKTLAEAADLMNQLEKLDCMASFSISKNEKKKYEVQLKIMQEI